MKLSKEKLEEFAEYCEYEVEQYEELIADIGNQLPDSGHRFLEEKVNSFREVILHLRGELDK